MLGREQKAIPLAHPWYDARTAGCKGTQIVMPVWSSVSGSSPAIKLLSRKSLMLLCDVQGGKRNLQVLPSPRKPKAKVGHLPILQGMERATSMAPLRMDCFGWRSAHRIFPANYGSSPSRSYAPVLRTADYARVSEAAGLEPMRSVTSIICRSWKVIL